MEVTAGRFSGDLEVSGSPSMSCRPVAVRRRARCSCRLADGGRSRGRPSVRTAWRRGSDEGAGLRRGVISGWPGRGIRVPRPPTSRVSLRSCECTRPITAPQAKAVIGTSAGGEISLSCRRGHRGGPPLDGCSQPQSHPPATAAIWSSVNSSGMANESFLDMCSFVMAATRWARLIDRMAQPCGPECGIPHRPNAPDGSRRAASSATAPSSSRCSPRDFSEKETIGFLGLRFVRTKGAAFPQRADR